MKALVLTATLAAFVAGTMAASAAPKKHYWRLVDRTLAANWTGSYAGLSFGYGWGRSSASRAFAGDASVPLTGFTASHNTFFGGVTAGYNFYTSNVVFGVEADLSRGRHRFRSGTLAFSDVLVPGDSLTGDVETRVTAFSTLRGRLGYLLDPQTMLYATGGLAAARSSARLSFSYDDGSGPTTASIRDSRTSFGWTAGIGIEDRFAENVSMKLEYLYVSLPRNRYRFARDGIGVGFDGKMRLHLFQAGINFHF